MENSLNNRVYESMSGAIILTGPSSCGKGEVARSLCDFFSIPAENWLSMGGILRETFHRAASDTTFRKTLADKYQISDEDPVLLSIDSSPDLKYKIKEHAHEISKYITEKRNNKLGQKNVWRSISQLEWLNFCVTHGELVPNRWTQNLVAAHIETHPQNNGGLFIFDGYPRTVAAAEHLVSTLNNQNIPVIKVLHLIISKQEMFHRAGLRKRTDDTARALQKRYEFYTDHVQPSIDYLKSKLRTEAFSVIDAHQPHYIMHNEKKTLDVSRSIQNVVDSVLKELTEATIPLDNGLTRPAFTLEASPK